MRNWLTRQRFCWLDMFGYGLFVGFGMQDRWGLAFAAIIAGIALPEFLRHTPQEVPDA